MNVDDAALSVALAPDEKDEHDHKKADAAKADSTPHGMRNDEVGRPSGLVFHHFARRRKRSQGQGRKGIHDDVHPQNLCYREGYFGSYNRAAEHKQQCREIHDELEEEEPLNIFIQRTAPHHGRGDGMEAVVKQRDVGSLLGNRRPCTQRKTHMRMIQCGSIVCSVARNGHNLSAFL